MIGEYCLAPGSSMEEDDMFPGVMNGPNQKRMVYGLLEAWCGMVGCIVVAEVIGIDYDQKLDYRYHFCTP